MTLWANAPPLQMQQVRRKRCLRSISLGWRPYSVEAKSFVN